MDKLTKPARWIFDYIISLKASLKHLECRDFDTFASDTKCSSIAAFYIMLIANAVKLLSKDKRELINKIIPGLEKIGCNIEHHYDRLGMDELYKYVQAFRDKETVIKIHRVLRGMEIETGGDNCSKQESIKANS